MAIFIASVKVIEILHSKSIITLKYGHKQFKLIFIVLQVRTTYCAGSRLNFRLIEGFEIIKFAWVPSYLTGTDKSPAAQWKRLLTGHTQSFANTSMKLMGSLQKLTAKD